MYTDTVMYHGTACICSGLDHQQETSQTAKPSSIPVGNDDLGLFLNTFEVMQNIHNHFLPTICQTTTTGKLVLPNRKPSYNEHFRGF